ncbi:glycoside hydrolase family 127 protein [Gramella sp. GC03-9]|uniref:Glycoside hydrolase family 127 protein n=1 Tax=Christiangramia oceanisediminis TaxID=2920386 RepID=A0A9X2I1C0_9FLAO|nr:glycoside hydrolase family 127 protein [Gramella oceanisediminis]MCP9199121.1 glycoside hydrolase family 127 protein [Gramella oceanisediminis]
MPKILIILSCLVLSGVSTFGQSAKVRTFHLKDVRLTDSPFRQAMLTDLDYILDLDPDRLLSPYLQAAGLQPKAENYPNWESMGLDGHIGGHYLTALAQMYASTGSEEAFQRLTYMLDELEKAQQANGNGYLGGVPDGKEIWKEIENGNIQAHNFGLNDRWVPLYNIHKVYAGLRDAYQVAGIEKARKMLVDFTDWMIGLTEDLSDEQIQELLISEHGGLNETFADVASITGEEKYLELAYRFSHKKLLNPLQSNKDILTGMHANTQIPKVIGFESIAQLDQNSEYHKAAEFFWDNVVNERSVAIGGNSVREHFNPVNDFSSMMNSEQGPETCNTYNMLRLSEKLFEVDPNEKYIDFYERALYNHILSTQHPETGGFVYFTPMRPGHYRVYSQPETSMWCCVGSGIENHGKYNKFIYAHSEDSLIVNLFIPSVLDWEERGLKVIQESDLEAEESTRLKFETASSQNLNLLLRYPSWVKEGELEIRVNGKAMEVTSEPGSYVSVDRTWENGDEVVMKLPMHLKAEKLPDNSNYQALTYGPYVLGAKTSDEDLEGLYADSGRNAHIAHGKKLPFSEMPVFLSDQPERLTDNIKKEASSELKFSASSIMYPSSYESIEFVPFYQIHDSRYVIYLPVETPESLAEIEKQRKQQELEIEKLEANTIDKVTPGEQQPEAEHLIEFKNSDTGIHNDRHWRDAEGYFSYVLRDDKNEAGKIRLTYHGNDKNRNFRILIDDILITEEQLEGEEGDRFFSKEYSIPDEVLANNKAERRIRFEAVEGSRTPGIYEIRLLKKED